MTIKFFKTHSEYNDLKRNGKSKIKFGIFFICIGILVFFAEYVGINEPIHNRYGTSTFGKAFLALMSILFFSLGKWIASLIFFIIGTIFIIWGRKDLKKSDADTDEESSQEV